MNIPNNDAMFATIQANKDCFENMERLKGILDRAFDEERITPEQRVLYNYMYVMAHHHLPRQELEAMRGWKEKFQQIAQTALPEEQKRIIEAYHREKLGDLVDRDDPPLPANNNRGWNNNNNRGWNNNNRGWNNNNRNNLPRIPAQRPQTRKSRKGGRKTRRN